MKRLIRIMGVAFGIMIMTGAVLLISSGTVYAHSEKNTFFIREGGEYTFDGNDSSQDYIRHILVVKECGDFVKIILKDWKRTSAGESLIDLQGSGDVEIEVNGECVLDASGKNNCAGIDISWKQGGSTFISSPGGGTGKEILRAYGGEYAAGIGGGRKGAIGKFITINNATIEAVGGRLGAGIGGAYCGDCYGLEINKSIIIAKGGGGAAAIGGGSCGKLHGDDYSFNNTYFKLQAGDQADAIGGGYSKRAQIPKIRLRGNLVDDGNEVKDYNFRRNSLDRDFAIIDGTPAETGSAISDGNLIIIIIMSALAVIAAIAFGVFGYMRRRNRKYR